MALPEDYVAEYFFSHVGHPKYNKLAKTYQGSCPICREGEHWLTKRRCYYIPKNNNIYCHNCGWSSTPEAWIARVTGKSTLQICRESLQSTVRTKPVEEVKVVQNNELGLPADAIKLFTSQSEFFKSNKVVQDAEEYLKARRLDTAVNHGDFWLSLSDKLHKNRIIIPFRDVNNKLCFYQSRQLYTDKTPRYLSSVGFDKSIFGLENLDFDCNDVIIHEGPFNSMFTKNGIAVGGIQENSKSSFTVKQEEQFQSLFTMNKIWLIDSQWLDGASYNKTKILLDEGEQVFIWPEKLGTKFKDVNDLCKALGRNELTHEFIKKYTYKGLSGKLVLSRVVPPKR